MFAPLIHKLAATDWRRNISNSRFLRETSEEISLQPVQKIKKGQLGAASFPRLTIGPWRLLCRAA